MNWARMGRVPAVFAAVFLLLPLPASAAAQTEAHSGGIWLDVPYVKQSEEGCGSASMAMLLRYWASHGAKVAGGRDDPEAIQEKLYPRKAHGIFASEMEKYLRESGFRVFVLNGNWGDLQEHLKKGRPLIVSLQPGGVKSPYHYVVVTGMDWEHEAVLLNDPSRGKLLRVERREFEKEWSALKNWLLLAVPAPAG